MLSAYIRTKNEAANIQRCIEAALSVADEVVVVDSGSTDNTIALAEAAGARVVHNDWPGMVTSNALPRSSATTTGCWIWTRTR